MAQLDLLVTPRSSLDRAGPFIDGVLRVRVTRPPADGEANAAVIRIVARALGVPPSSVTLVAGRRGRRKRVEVAGVDAGTLAERLAGLAAD